MGHDTTPERSDLVAFFTVLTVFFIVTVTGGVWAIYKVRTAEERAAKRNVSAVEAAQAELAKARTALENGPVPIEQAMAQVARQGRRAAPALAVVPGEFDRGPLEGWAASKGPATMGGVAVAVVEPKPAPAPATGAPEEGEAADAGEQPAAPPAASEGDTAAAPSP